MRVLAAILTVLCGVACADNISISSNFNGTAIPAGDTIWFNAVLNPPSLSGGPVTLNFTGGTISFTAGSTAYNIALPNATVTWSSAYSTATTTWNSGSNTWVTTAPITYSGNIFLDGAAFLVPAGGFAGGIHPVSWTMNATGNSAAAGYTFQWQWAAAVYTSFNSNLSSDCVKPTDSNTLSPSPFNNSDHAGTPECKTSYVTGGATGGGGSNYTGSYSGTGSFTPTQQVPEPASLALLGSGLAAIALRRRRR